MTRPMSPEQYRRVIDSIYHEVLPFRGRGRVADYIPALAAVNPRQFGLLTPGSRTLCKTSRNNYLL